MKRALLYLWNFWPPFLGAGIKIDHISKDMLYARVRLKKRRWTSNFVGTQYGGSIFAMTDAFYLVMLIVHLGRDYIVWDKSASIRYKKPGTTELNVEFRLTVDDVAQIRARLESEPKIDWTRKIDVKNTDGDIVAEVEKVIHIRKKSPKVT